MRAVVCRALGGLENLVVEDGLPSLVPGPGQVRIAVHAAGINFADSLMVSGKYQEKKEPPFTPGMEVAGTVAELGTGVTGLAVGDRVMAVLDGGGFADEALAAAEDVHPMPAGMDFVTAAAFPVAYGTSHLALTWRAGLKAGEVLLVHGAAGGVGLTAVEVGHALGATVIATAGGAEKLEVARAHGAAHGIDYKTEDVRTRVKELTGGRGADVVYDPVGGPVFDASLRCTAPNARLLTIGFASGTVPQIPANLLLVKNLTVIGFYWGAYRKLDPAAIRASFAELGRWFEQGRLRPHVSHTHDLAEAPAAVGRLLDRAATGKVVLTTGRS